MTNTVDYKGFKIEIFYDDFDFDNPNEWGDEQQLVHYHRDYTIKSEVITEHEAKEFANGVKIEQLKKYYIFPVTSYIHSGIRLYLGEKYGFDNSNCGLILIDRTEATNEISAQEIANKRLNTWNCVLNGEVYGFYIEKIDDSRCGGYIGDPKTSGLMDEARSTIDYHLKRKAKLKQAKLKKYIKSQVPLQYRFTS